MLADGSRVLARYVIEIGYLLFTAFGIGRLWGFIFSRMGVFPSLRHPIISINLGLLTLPVFLFPVAFFQDTRNVVRIIGAFLLVIAICGIVLSRYQIWEFYKSCNKWSILTCALFILLLIVRLAYLQKAIFPGYYDSETHYRIVEDFFHLGTQSISYYSIRNFFSVYYHFGYHYLVILLVGLFNIPIASGMLVVGQIALWLFSLNVYFLIVSISKKTLAGVFGLLLSVFAWHMPSFAVNWGRYPALFGIAFFPVICCLILSVDLTRKKVPHLLIVAFFSLLNLIFHSRVLFLITALIISLILLHILANPKTRLVIIGLSAVLIGWLIADNEGLFSIYIKNNYLLAGTFVVMLPFAVKNFPKLSFALLLFTLLCMIFVKVPFVVEINNVKNHLLDDSFVAILISAPLVTFITLEMLGVIEQFQKPWIVYPLCGVLLSIAVIPADMQTLFYPHPCCNYVTTSTLSAFDWITKNISQKSKIGIPGISMNEYLRPADAGAWIEVTTLRKVKVLEFSFRWDKYKELTQACEQNIDYVFVGGNPKSFDRDLFKNGKWYSEVFSNDSIEIFKLEKCKESIHQRNPRRETFSGL